jgi:hypothetical protein
MASAEAVVAATEARDRAGTIIAAALSLPGVLAHAENAPEHGEVALKYLHYQDSQPDLKRIRVEAPSLYVLAPLSSRWSVEGSFVYDSVSGATPRYHTAISGATPRMTEERKAGDVKVTHYRERSSYSVGVSQSSERDYESSAASLESGFSSDDGNRTWNLGVGYAFDTVGSTNDATLHERKRTAEALLGVTQALTANDLVQLNGTFVRGRGYFSDPYKEPDIRPRKRDEAVVLARWNHHFGELGASLRSSYRFYHDTFGISAHTVAAEWVQHVGPMVTVTPSLRLYSQSAAKFYFDPVYDPDVGAPYPPGYFTNPPQYISPDQRLSAFGGVTVGLKLGLQISPDWSTDIKAEHYEQRSSWRVGGTGSPGLEPFRATFVQVGIGKRF